MDVVGFHVDDLEFIHRDWEHREDFVVKEAEVSGDEVVFVHGRGIFSFSNEEFCDVWKCFSEGFDCGEFVVVVVKGFAFYDEVFDLDGDCFGEVGHCGGEIFICLDLEDSLNRL